MIPHGSLYPASERFKVSMGGEEASHRPDQTLTKRQAIINGFVLIVCAAVSCHSVTSTSYYDTYHGMAGIGKGPTSPRFRIKIQTSLIGPFKDGKSCS